MTKEEVLSRIDPFLIYNTYIPGLQRTNGYTRILSPFRDEKNESFAIYWNDNCIWKDFATGESGNVFDFIMKYDNVEFIIALHKVCDIAGIEIKKEKRAKETKSKLITAEDYKKSLQNFEKFKPGFIFDRWQKRKISLQILREHNVGIRLPYQKVNDPYRFYGAFIIPLSFDTDGNVSRSRVIYWDNRQGINIVDEKLDGKIKHISWNNKPGYDATGLLGITRKDFIKSEQIILCEGEEDYFSLISNGFVAVTGLCGAGTFKKEWTEYFKDKEVVILYDNDDAGHKGATQAAELLFVVAKSVKIAGWINHKDKYDVGDFFEENRDTKVLTQIINTAKPFVPDKSVQKKKNTIAEQIKAAKNKHDLKELFYYQPDKGTLQLLQQTVAEYIVKEYKLCTTSESERNVNWYQYYDGSWHKISSVVIETIVRSVLAIEPTFAQIQAIVKSARSIRHISPSDFNNYPTLINLNNCIYDLENYTEIVHSESYYFNYKNIYDYDPEADCRYFHGALNDYSLQDIDWISALFEVIGYCLTGTYEKQKMFWFTGSSGGNGKGTVLRVMEKLVGYAMTKPGFQPSKLGGNFYKKDLIGKRLAIAGDLPPFMSNIATIKELSGGDRQSTDVKFGDSVDFVNVAKLVFAMNQMPEFPANETIDPILRRIYLLPFKFQIKDYDITLETKFEKELPGIFNEAIAGLKRFRARGDFPVVDSALKEVKMWLGGVTTFESYLFERIVEDPNGMALGKDLWQDYSEFMANTFGQDWQKEPKIVVKDKINFGRQIKKKFMNIKTERTWYEISKSQVTKYIGIRFMSTKADYENKGITVEESEFS